MAWASAKRRSNLRAAAAGLCNGGINPTTARLLAWIGQVVGTGRSAICDMNMPSFVQPGARFAHGP